MFTGIIEEIGIVKSVDEHSDLVLWDGRKGQGFVLVISCKTVLEGAYLGCSIAVNGVCLTVTAFGPGDFTVNCAPETLRLTNLGQLKPNDKVNLERSAKFSDRNSGHFVQGHVDNTAVIKDFRPDGDSLYVRLQPPADLMKFIVAKGYVALDGTSLTVCEVNREQGWFSVMLIAFTQKKIILPLKQRGDHVNVEVDVMSKYVESSVTAIRTELESLRRQQRHVKLLGAAGFTLASLLLAITFLNRRQ